MGYNVTSECLLPNNKPDITTEDATTGFSGVAVVSIRAGRRITSYVPLEFPTKGEYNSTNQLLARPLSVHVCVCFVVGASNKVESCRRGAQ